MLQQTTVKTVLPYYERFLKKFPDLKTLAAASLEEVLAAWSGLGYYSRARNLHATAKRCVQEFGGTLPSALDTLKTLPGIGAYTAGAIASIAFGRRAPLLDGNVARVLSRLFKIDADPKNPAGQRVFWSKAEAVLPRNHCGDFNQALMELGATVCTPTQPTCGLCPVQKHCVIFREDDPGAYPKILRKTQYINVALTAAVLQQGQSVLLLKRPAQGMLSELWEFPMVEGDLSTLEKLYGLRLKEARPLSPVRHTIMNRRMKIEAWHLQVPARKKIPLQTNARWFTFVAVAGLPTSSLNLKLLHCVRG